MTRRAGQEEADRILDFEGFPGRWEILETAEETDGARFTTRMEIEERSELPPHVHSNAEESYEVVAGELEVLVDGTWSTVAAGDTRVVSAGTEHSFRNLGTAEVINTHRPAMRFEEFFRRFHTLKTERGVAMPPDGVAAAILLAMLLVEYEEEQVVVSPPHWVFRALARVGRLRGYRLPD
jgi:mannose-6-phosphate isomerase-like protein (cupin superfamily)